MRIVIVNHHRQDVLGGSEIQCDLIANGLQARGHEVLYIAPSRSGTLFESPYKIVPVTWNGAAIGRAVTNARPDVVYWRLNKHGFYAAARMIHRAGIPIVFAVSHINDITPWSYKAIAQRNWKTPLKIFRRLLQSRWNHQGFQFVTAVTTNNPDHLALLPGNHRHYIPNAMLVDALPFQWARPFCVWVANIKPAKRPELFIRLAEKLQAEDIDFLMVGPIQDSEYEWIREQKNCPDNFDYLGPKTPEEVNGILAASLLHIHTCYPEGFSNIFIQAWLQQKPSISFGFDPGGYIQAEGLGFVADDNFDLFITQTRELLSDDAKRKSMGQRAQVFAREHFGVERLVDQVERLLCEVVDSRPRI